MLHTINAQKLTDLLRLRRTNPPNPKTRPLALPVEVV